MATGTVIFRPNADTSLAHSCSTGSSGYPLISEAAHDSDSTYIYQTLSSTSSRSVTSSFSMAAQSSIPSNATFTSARLHIVAIHSDDNGTGNVSGSVTVGSKTANLSNQTVSKSYSDLGGNSLDVNGQSGSSTVTVSITSSGTKASGMKSSNGYVRITQAYLEIDYEYTDGSGTGVYFKQNNAWKEATVIYKKQSGSWVQVDKSALDSQVKYVLKQ